MWRFIATVFTSVVAVEIAGVFVIPGGVTGAALGTLFVSIPMSMLGLSFADFVAPPRGFGRLIVFTLGGALMGSALWVFYNFSGMLPFGAFPGDQQDLSLVFGNHGSPAMLLIL